LVINIKQMPQMIIWQKFTQEQVDDLNSKIKTTEEALQWVSDNLHPKVAKASSFGAEDAVIMDIMLKINPKFRFFTLDTGRLPQETYDIMDIVRKNIIFRLKYYFLILEKLKKWLMKKEWICLWKCREQKIVLWNS